MKFQFKDGIELTKRELDALRRMNTGLVESEGDLPGVGEKTYSSLLSFGLIERTVCSTYGTDGHRITPLGEEILEDHWKRIHR